MTGLAQIKGKVNMLTRAAVKRVRYDICFCCKRHLLFDIELIVKTGQLIPRGLRGKERAILHEAGRREGN